MASEDRAPAGEIKVRPPLPAEAAALAAVHYRSCDRLPALDRPGYAAVVQTTRHG